jgi:cytochrome c peroxidase
MIARAAGSLALAMACLAACGDDPTDPEDAEPDPRQPWVWDLPPGFPVPIVPRDNPMSQEKVELGRHLFHDRRLSENGTQSCATCHRQELAFTDGRAAAVGSTGQPHPRGSMSLANVGWVPSLTWANPVLVKLETQTLVPVFGTDPVELGWSGLEHQLEARLAQDPVYRDLFAAAFPGDDAPVSVGHVVMALAAFERTLVSASSPYDRARSGEDPSAMSDAARRGQALFESERLACSSCHGGFALSEAVVGEGTPFDGLHFFNNGLYDIDGEGSYPPPSTGVFAMTGRPEDMGRFRVPTLRNIAVTAPYMHDGSLATLDDVLDHYARGGSGSPLQDPRIQGFELPDEDRADLLAFLESLTDEAFLTDERFADPWAR